MIGSAEWFRLVGGVSVWVFLLGGVSAGLCLCWVVFFRWVVFPLGAFFSWVVFSCCAVVSCYVFPYLSFFFRCVVFQMSVFQMCFSDVFFKCFSDVFLSVCSSVLHVFSCFHVFSVAFISDVFSDVCFFDVWFRKCVVSLMRFIFRVCFF